MKQISIVINIVLLFAVAILYYLHFSGNKKNTNTKTTASSITRDSCGAGSKITMAYVELDSVNENVSFIKDRKNELEAEQRQIANDYENAYHGLEAEKNNFLKRGNAITQQEAEEFQAKLAQKQQMVEEDKQAKAQKLSEKGAKIMEDIQSKLKIFMSEFNKDKRYTYILATGTGLDYLFYKDDALNITGEVITALNEKMKAGK